MFSPNRNRTAFNSQLIRRLFEDLESRTLLSSVLDPASIIVTPNLALSPQVNAASVSGYSPSQIAAAYGFNNVTLSNGAKGTGAGQTIAIVDAYNDPNISADLHTFDQIFGLSDPNLSVVSQSGSAASSIATNAGWAAEISLDVEWAHAIAPGAKILLVEANSDSLSNLMSAVNYARNAAGVSVVSMSWGSSEFSGETSYDSLFTTPAGHQGVTFVSASGDEGSRSGPEWPSSSGNVLSVGGTTLNINSTGAISSETAWNNSTGGVSRYESTPSYQAGVTTASGRSSPDVSYDANPNTGFAVYDSLAFEGSSGWSVVGGTSAGAPQWGALIAIADQGRSLAGEGTLSGASTLSTLYSMYSTSSVYAADFNDIAVTTTAPRFGGGRFFRGWWGGGFNAPVTVTQSAGYDTVTGLGTPKAASVVRALIGATSGSTTKASSVASSATRAASRAQAAAKVASSPALETEPESARAIVNTTDVGAIVDETIASHSAIASVESGSGKITFIADRSASFSETPVTMSSNGLFARSQNETVTIAGTIASPDEAQPASLSRMAGLLSPLTFVADDTSRAIAAVSKTLAEQPLTSAAAKTIAAVTNPHRNLYIGAFVAANAAAYVFAVNRARKTKAMETDSEDQF